MRRSAKDENAPSISWTPPPAGVSAPNTVVESSSRGSELPSSSPVADGSDLSVSGVFILVLIMEPILHELIVRLSSA